MLPLSFHLVVNFNLTNSYYVFIIIFHLFFCIKGNKSFISVRKLTILTKRKYS